jgi:hypothetical protein
MGRKHKPDASVFKIQVMNQAAWISLSYAEKIFNDPLMRVVNIVVEKIDPCSLFAQYLEAGHSRHHSKMLLKVMVSAIDCHTNATRRKRLVVWAYNEQSMDQQATHSY